MQRRQQREIAAAVDKAMASEIGSFFGRGKAKHDCWNPACIAAQHAGKSCALCLACQVIRDALRAG